MFNSQSLLSYAGIISRLELAFVAFSVPNTTKAIFAPNRPLHDELPVLHGVRTLSIFWVFWGVSYIFGPLANECWSGGNSLFSNAIARTY